MRLKSILQRILSAHKLLESLNKAEKSSQIDWGKNDFLDHRKRSQSAKLALLKMNLTLQEHHQKTEAKGKWKYR